MATMPIDHLSMKRALLAATDAATIAKKQESIGRGRAQVTAMLTPVTYSRAMESAAQGVDNIDIGTVSGPCTDILAYLNSSGSPDGVTATTVRDPKDAGIVDCKVNFRWTEINRYAYMF